MTTPSTPPTPHLLADYSEQARTQALTRFQQLQPHLEDGVALSALARKHGVPLRTMQYWLQQYRQHGLAGLCRPPSPPHLARRIVPQLVELIEGLALRTPPPTAAAVHRQVVTVAQQHGWAAPSYRTVYGIIRSIDPGLRTLAHDGAKVYQEAFDLLYRREATRPNEMWQADHCYLDLWLLDPSGKPRRP
jgi:putative transposase